MGSKTLKIKGARENNLKDLSLELPHDTFTVITGLSGSGKSSLAFDTVYAEGQRRYIETFSPYTRQFFDKVKKPDVDTIQNVRPAIAIQQRTRVTGSRSTVGSMTNIIDYIKIIWSNLSSAVCPECGDTLVSWTPQSLALHLYETITKRDEKDQFLLIAPYTIATKHVREEIDRLSTLGFTRMLDVDSSEICSIEDVGPTLKNGEILLVLDRMRSSSVKVKRLRDTIDQAFSLSDGACLVLEQGKRLKEASLFHNYFFCPKHKTRINRPRPALFSYNHPYGACPDCRGFGKILSIDPAKCVPDTTLSIKGQAIQCWTGSRAQGEYRRLLRFCEKEKIDIQKPWRNLKAEERDRIFNHKSKEFRGINHWFKRIERKAYKMHVRVFLSRYRTQVTCPTCSGSRLRKDALSFKINGRLISDLWNLPLSELLSWFSALESETEKDMRSKLKDVFLNIHTRLQYLNDLGLPYLTLERAARTLSGGETQRVNLASALGSELVSTHFVLDEPSVGLHARDTERLLSSIHSLSAKGNSLLVVEHDPECIFSAEHILELGPEAGRSGGEVIYNGPAESWKGIRFEPIEFQESKKFKEYIAIRGARSRNLKKLDIDIPLHAFVTLTGVSGSGKSTLAHEVIRRAWDVYKGGDDAELPYDSVKGFDKITQLLIVDQSPLAKSPRANIATYSGIWDVVRDLLSSTEAARLRALSRSSFSFNVNAGRCTACEGAGFIREDMQFLSDVYIPCEVCLGKRFQEVVLEVSYDGKNVDDFLRMTIDDALVFFNEHGKVKGTLSVLSSLGLGHLTLGHSLSELSGGEAQRLKLVPFLDRSGEQDALLIFDEPTTGLHLYDIQRLVSVFRSLVERGHSVLCIEHNLSLVATSDWVIDLGPEGGDEGGELLFDGSPHEMLKEKNFERSYTAKYLNEYIEKTSDRKSNQKKLFSIAAHKKTAEPNELIIQGAREHNLKDVDLRIPLRGVVALTGVSGSGKSSIAKDIVYAEGQRRYLDCLSPYARQFIKELKKPEIDSITNVKPTICVYQHTFQPSHLSTVGTMSEVYNFLRLLYAKTGIQFCPDHPDQEISPLSARQIAEAIKNISSSSIRILAPIIKLKKGTHRAVFQRALASEITEVRVDGIFGRPSQFETALEKGRPHTIEYVVAKFNPKNLDVDLVYEAVTLGLGLGGGTLIALTEKAESIFSIDRTCPVCQKGFFKPDPEDLSFHSRRGRCARCEGTGVAPKGGTCPVCGGDRLNSLGRNLRLGGKNIHEAALLNPSEFLSFIRSLSFDKRRVKIAEPVLSEIVSKIESLIDLGLDYLSLDRDCSTLSGGELQRLRLSAAMGSPLSGVLYIFDEPSIGLHPLDNAPVLQKLRSLSDRGNSVIMIEHDSQSILSTDHVIDVGPGGGTHGGTIVFNGPLAQFLKSKESLTARAIQESAHLPLAEGSRSLHTLKLKGGTKNNIRRLDLELPLQSIVTFAGISGAGKSSLLHGIIADTLLEGKKSGSTWTLDSATVSTDTEISRVLYVDQKPIGLNSRSTPASYLGIWDDIRTLFSKTLEAQSRGWSAGFFSYNTGKGRCSECKGQGFLRLEMSFLADAEIQCEVCKGSRYGEEVESVKYLGKSISEVLSLTFEEAKTLFANHRKIFNPLRFACDLGLGYLTLGQGSSTLSGGESQRIKLVSELSNPKRGHTLFVLDEPTTGLHKVDVAKLMASLRSLVSLGNTVYIIEHDRDVIQDSDYIVELGPGPGEEGGRVIFEGSPKKLLRSNTPWGELLRNGNPVQSVSNL